MIILSVNKFFSINLTFVPEFTVIFFYLLSSLLVTGFSKPHKGLWKLRNLIKT